MQLYTHQIYPSPVEMASRSKPKEAIAIAAITTTIVPYKPRQCCKENEEERYEAVLSTANLHEERKNTIRRRYLPLIQDFKGRAYCYMLLFHIGHLIITVGSLIVPALLSVQYTTSLAAYQNNIYWLTWTLSLLVTTFNGILVLFKVDKKYYYLHTAIERLRSEGWQYIALTGRYSGILLHHAEEPTHENQFRFFCHYVEKLKLKQVEEEYYKYEEASNPTAPNQAAQKAQEGILPPSINKEIGGMAPPTSVKEVMRGLLKGESDGLETPKESKNTIVIPVPQ